MKLNSIRWRLPLSYAAIALIAAFTLGSVMLLVLHNYYANLELEYLTGNAQALKPVMEQILKAETPKQILQEQLSGLGFISQTQIRFLDENGQIIADSGTPGTGQTVEMITGGAIMDGTFSIAISSPAETNPANLIVVGGTGLPSQGVDITSPPDGTIIGVNAFPMGGYGFVTNPMPVSQKRSMQVATLQLDNSLGVLEISNGPAYGSDILRAVALAWALAGFVAVLLAAWAGFYISRQVTRPVLALTEATRRMESGELSTRIDLPHEKQLEFMALAHAFNGMAGQVENTVSTLRAFVSDAAHELNTPLTALKTNLELAAAEQDSARRENFLARALEQNQRLEGLTRSLLDLSRIESAQSDFSTLDLRQLVAETGERFASRAEQAERSFSLTLPEGESQVRGNFSQLQRALDNLLENALKFTSPGGTIALSLENSENLTILTFTDTGIGIPPEDVSHLFERFHRGRNAAGYSGNGLGLAIVKAVVKAHNGEIRAESVLGGGTKITMELPHTIV